MQTPSDTTNMTSIIDFTLSLQIQPAERTFILTRNIKTIDITKFQDNLKQELDSLADINDQELYHKFISTIESRIDSHSLLKQKSIARKKDKPWFDKEALILKTKHRNAERRWTKTKTKHDQPMTQGLWKRYILGICLTKARLNQTHCSNYYGHWYYQEKN